MSLCNKCGHIHDFDNLSAELCSCGKQYLIETIMMNPEEYYNKTNLTTCMSCKSKNNRGVIESFYIGKDSASAIVAQLIYKSMDREYDTEFKRLEIANKNNLFGKNVETNTKKEEFIKQFIAFSDSRQQASYFATYFEDRHENFLRKRLVVDELQINKKQTILNLVDSIKYKIEKYDLFPKTLIPQQQAWIAVLTELLDIDRKFSLSGLGLIEFSFNDHITAKLDSLTSEDIYSDFNGMDIEDFKNILNFIFSKLRTIPAIDYNDFSKFTFDERKEYLQYRFMDNSGIALNLSGSIPNVTSLIPQTKGGNQFTDYLIRSFQLNLDTSKEYLEKVWNFITNHLCLLQNNPAQTASFITPVENFKVTLGENVTWYKCDKCQTLTSININNTCVRNRCIGKLSKCVPNIIHEDNFYYNEYKSKNIEKIRIEEHTAQLTKLKGREYQKDFIEGKINILSSTTTFEMGVDIGNLDTVYMRNVPPTPANYIQRAGRAGRRQETSAFVVTFCSSNSHDFTYYEQPEKMIEGKIIPPYFDVENKKIIDRHILSVALSLFFRKNPDYFSKIEYFIENDGSVKFKEYLLRNKDSFCTFISKNIEPRFESRFPEWMSQTFDEEESTINKMTIEIIDSIRVLNEILKDTDNEEFSYKGKVKRNLKTLLDESILKNLSRFNVIPSYGFPIDTVRLNIPSNQSIELQRDLVSALSEFAPESEVLVDKVKYRSRYINIPNKSKPITKHYLKCSMCDSLIISWNKYDDSFKKCRHCNYELNGNPDEFIKPVYGFIAEHNNIASSTIKPKQTYSSKISFMDNSENFEEIIIGDTIRLSSVKHGELALLNENPFFVCMTCGYTEIDHKQKAFNKIKKEHGMPKSNYTCTNDNLQKYSLGHDFKTDVVLIDFMDSIDYQFTVNQLYSVMNSMLVGISEAFQIEQRDITGLVQNVRGKQRILIFDNVPGGAGHVKRLINEKEFIRALKHSLKKVSIECCDESTSCYNCLRNYNNQKQHNILKRGDAKFCLEIILSNIESESNKNNPIFENYSYSKFTWKELVKVPSFSFLITFFEKKIPIANYALVDLKIEQEKIYCVLVWQKENTILVENINEINNIKSLNGWNIFDLNQLNELLIHLEVK